MKIDIFNHIFPKKYYDKYIDAGQSGKDMGKRVANIKTIVDVDSRFRALDPLGDYVQVITLPVLPIEVLAGPEKSPELAPAPPNTYPHPLRSFEPCARAIP